MKFGTLIRRSLRFHWRSHLGVVLGAAIGSAALIGALVVGDSVKHTLRFQAVMRLPGTSVALDSGDRFFGADLLTRMIKEGNAEAKKVSTNDIALTWGNGFTVVESKTGLRLDASVRRADGSAQLQRINLYSFDAESMAHIQSGSMSMPGMKVTPFPSGGVWLNHNLAQQLNAKVDDELIFRIPKPTALSHDAAISPRNDTTAALRLRVVGISPQPQELPPAWQQRFIDKVWYGGPPTELDLHPTSRPAMNAFVDLSDLYQAVPKLEGKANFILASSASEMRKPNLWERFQAARATARRQHSFKPVLSLGWLREASSKWGFGGKSQETLQTITPIFHAAFNLADAQASLTKASEHDKIELKSSRIFLDPPLAQAALSANTNAQPVLTYLVNLMSAGTNSTPYSMVTAAGAPWTPADLRDDEIMVSRWLAEDLRVKAGDEIALVYFDPESGIRLSERTNTFRVRNIVPAERPWADRTLMPDFPGIENAESTSEWDAGFPLTYKIRPQDEDYWKKYRGTPKAFVTLAAGQKMWGNRFGNLTAIRFPISGGFATNRQALEKKILANLKPEDLGLRFEPVREQALKAASESQDFGGLFLGFSFFLIIAALLLMAMLFQFGLEQRAPEIGTLLALGFTAKQVRKLLMREGIALAFIGGIIGTIGGIYFAKTMLHALTTIWRDAVGATALSFHYTTQTLAIGLLSSVIVSAITIWLALRKFVKRPARELLAGDIASNESRVLGVRYKVLAIVSLLVAIGLVGWALAKRETANAEVFFSAGSLILIAGLGFASAWLARKSNAAPSPAAITQPTLGSLALRGCARRRKRSLATIAMLACGSFLIVSIGVFRLDANIDATKKTSGTGGFALLGETTMPVVQDLNAKAGRDFFALSESDLKDVHFVPFRVRAGDEASCLNLNAAQQPRLLGVNPEMMAGRFSFAKGAEWKSLASSATNDRPLTPALSPDGGEGGSARDAQRGDGARAAIAEIPAIGDANSIQWAMHKKIGDTIDYVDERGQAFKVRIIGAVANSILQGQLIIDEAEFVKRFPGESGYRMFLIDAPSNAVSQVSATLSRAMQDVGLELTPTVQRLAQFNAVQNTYLGTFQVLGGLGLLLGSVGLGIVVLRNVLERRGELAVMIALGFRKGTVQSLLLMENGALLLAGLAIGVIAAAVAVLPAVLSPSAQLPYGSLAVTLAAVLVNGALWTWAATKLAVRGDLLKALRNE